MQNQNGKASGLLPLFLFVCLFVGSGLITGDFYSLPIVAAALAASVVSLAMNRKEKLSQKTEWFAKGAGHPDIMIMVMIFILAGAFSSAAKAMGAVESTVNLALSFVPGQFMVAGLFIIAAFISVSMGTSTGTIAALAPQQGSAPKSAFRRPIRLLRLWGARCSVITYHLFPIRPLPLSAHKRRKCRTSLKRIS